VNINSFNIQGKYKEFVNRGTIFSFLGSFSQDQLDNVLIRTEILLEKSLDSKLIIKKIYNILVESVQNIHKYQINNNQQQLNQAFVFVNEFNKGYKVITGNYILKQDVRSIQSRIEIVNALQPEELKDLYRGVLEIGGVSEHGGAGLGFIDMAKKGSGELIYDFCEVDADYVFFTLETNIVI
jgi:hypothetical protein